MTLDSLQLTASEEEKSGEKDNAEAQSTQSLAEEEKRDPKTQVENRTWGTRTRRPRH